MAQQGGAPGGATQKITDNTETNLINLRRTIYLTIMSALDFEEAGHKLMKIQLGPGQETEVATMIIECCSQEKSYSKCAAPLPYNPPAVLCVGNTILRVRLRGIQRLVG